MDLEAGFAMSALTQAALVADPFFGDLELDQSIGLALHNLSTRGNPPLDRHLTHFMHSNQKQIGI